MIHKTPLVSISVVSYNHQDYIKECLDGILMQKTNFPFEIILGEDESTDGTREICIEYANIYPDKINLFLRSRKDVIYINGNPTGRYNFIENLKASKGKYIALCEGDDYWTDPLKLQKQVDLLESNTDLIACHHWQTIAIEQGSKFIETESPKHGYYPKKVSSVEVIFANKMRAKTRTLMFRNIIDEDFFPNWYTKVAFGDVPLTFLLGKYGDFGFIDEKMAVYRQTDNGVSKAGLKELGVKNFNVQHFKNWIQIWDYANKHYKYKYHNQATNTISDFYKIMIGNLPIKPASMLHLIKYNIVDRKIPFFKTLPHSLWLIFYYGKNFGYKIKRKLQKL